MRIFMPADKHDSMRALSDDQIQQFIQDGFVRVDRAFPRELADEARAMLWRDIPCDPYDQTTWKWPVVRLPGYGGEPFQKAVNTSVLHGAFDQLVGKGRWIPRDGLGTFPERFPHPDDPGDAGWHIDVSFPGDDCDPNEQNDYSAWRANVTPRGRALTMLFLFSDVGVQDAPTRIRAGSHLDMARFLAPAGETGMSHWCWIGWARAGRKYWRPERQAQSICVTPLSSTPHRCTAARHRGSWRNPRSTRPSHSGSIGWTATIHQSRSRFGKLSRGRKANDETSDWTTNVGPEAKMPMNR
jgi:hypothetical protein